MKAVNLLPRDLTTQGRRLPPLPVFAGCVGVVLVTAVIAVMYLAASAKVGDQRRALDAARAEYAAIPSPAAPSPLVSQLPQQRQARVAALAEALGQRVAWDRLMREISQVVPSDVYLTNVTAKAPVIAPSGTPLGTPPQGFQVNGCTYSQASVARFLARLDLVPDLTEMTLGKSGTNVAGSSNTGDCPGGLFSFSLLGNVRTGAS